MTIDTAAVAHNSNSKVLRIGMVVEDRGRPSVDQMQAIAEIVDEWRAGVGPVHASPAPRPDLVEMLRDAERLLNDSRYHGIDPGQRQTYARQRTRLRDRILNLL